MAKHRGASTKVDRPITNQLRGLEVHKDGHTKPIPFVQIWAVIALIFLALVMADKCNIIHVSQTQGL